MLGIDANDLAQRIRRIDSIYHNTSGRPSEIAKYKIEALAEVLNRDIASLCRVFVAVEAQREASEVQPLLRDLTDAVNDWRKQD